MTNRSRTGESRRSAPRILALDLMSKLGWACRANDGSLHYGTETFKLKGIESTGMRFMRFRDWLDEIVVEVVKPEAIFFEQLVGFPRKNMGRDSSIYHGFAAHLTEYCDRAGYEYQGVSVGTIKKFITGNGNAGKPAVIAAVKALGHSPEDDNQADAIALLLYAESLTGKPGA